MKFSSIYFCLFIAIVLGASLSGCADRSPRISEPVAWGDAESVVQADNLFFAGQPDREGLRMARDAGVSLVVNMRSPDEMTWDEAAAVTELGMEYLNIPISGSGPGFDRATIERLNELVAANADQKILLHCSSGNRSSAWYGIYLVQQKGYTLDEAVPMARQTGLTRDALETRMRQYLDEK